MKKLYSVDYSPAIENVMPYHIQKYIEDYSYTVTVPCDDPHINELSFTICNNRIISWSPDYSASIIYPNVDRNSCNCLNCIDFFIIGIICCDKFAEFYIESKELLKSQSSGE